MRILNTKERPKFEKAVTEYLEDISKNVDSSRKKYVKALIKCEGRYYLCTLGEEDEGGFHHADCDLLPIPISLEVDFE